MSDETTVYRACRKRKRHLMLPVEGSEVTQCSSCNLRFCNALGYFEAGDIAPQTTGIPLTARA